MKWVLASVAGLALGVAGGWLAGARLAEAAAEGRIFASGQLIDYGAWQSSQALGSADGDPILIAWIARTGILPLARSEVAYYFTEIDASGARLDPDCAYAVSVPPTDARWWSVAVYDEARKPIANRLDRYSFNSDGGTSAVTLSRTPPPSGEEAWLPLGEAASIELLFRVYQPGTGFDPDAENAMPRVERIEPCSS